ncbi:MAG: NADH-quinone oxidoreductase subunit J [Chloroflexi bacterium]|nr:NADH-quinone oxidoreductase subunit J [Chloroflexota bacterium]
MTSIQIIFLLAAAGTLAAGVFVVSSPKILHAALWLIVSLFGIAIMFALLQANFFAVIQVVVYIGAIAILIIFGVMLTRRIMQDTGLQLTRFWWGAALASLGIFAGLITMLSGWKAADIALPEMSSSGTTQAISQLGQALVSPDAYVLPFEAASILLVVAMIGAIYIALDRK